MSKATHLNHVWQTRTASFSTHGSRKGVNLLGWDGVDEHMTPEQERAALAARAGQLQRIFEAKAYAPKDKKRLADEFNQITARINYLRPKMRLAGIERFLLDIMRERLSKQEWNAMMQEAKRRLAAEMREQGQI